MVLTSQVPMQYCSYSIGVYFHHKSHPQLGIIFALAQLLHFFWSSKITMDGDGSHEIFFLERKAMEKLDSILKSKDITLPTKALLVKAMVFPVVIHGCESWTIKKAVQFSSVAQSCSTLCNPMDFSTPGLLVHHQPLEFIQTYVH